MEGKLAIARSRSTPSASPSAEAFSNNGWVVDTIRRLSASLTAETSVSTSTTISCAVWTRHDHINDSILVFFEELLAKFFMNGVQPFNRPQLTHDR